MFLKLVALAILAIVAESAVPARPTICSTFITVAETPAKYLCYVKKDFTAFQASKNCAKNGMTLYDPTTSTLANNALVDFGATLLGGSKRAEVFIKGRAANKCQVFVGNGKTKYIPCTTGLHSVCEIITQPTIVQCQSYHPNFNGNSFVNTVGIATPRTCVYNAAISESYTALTVDSTLAKANVIAVDFAGTATVLHMPVGLGSNFPNLNMILASGLRITTLSYDSFRGAVNLKWIDLSDNLITSFDATVFRDAVNLQQIILDDNQLIAVNFATFASLPLLTTVGLQSSGCIDNFANTRAMVLGLPGNVAGQSCTAL